MKVTIKTLEDLPEVPDVDGHFGSLDLAKQAAVAAGNQRHDTTKGCTMCLMDENGEELARVAIGEPEAAPAEGEEKAEEGKKPKSKSKSKPKKKDKKKKKKKKK